MTVKFGLFQTPYTHPTRTPRQTFAWAVDQVVAAEIAGFDEAWIGEHFTLAWESIPSPELVLAAAARQTERIILAPGAHLGPYHQPATLAAQTAWLSHIVEGRYILGLATGVNPVDAQLHGLKSRGENLAITLEALDVMEKIWAGEPFEYEGTYWSSTLPDEDTADQKIRDLRPYGGKMRVSFGGASPNSTSIQAAGARGLLPMSFGATPELIANHWQTYREAALQAGRAEETLDRTVQRVTLLTVFAADTDAEAVAEVKNGPIGRAWREYIVPHEQHRAHRAGIKPVFDINASMDDLIRHRMIVGSPATVAEKLNTMIDASGGWGTALVVGHDYIDDPAPWNYSMELLAQEVAPLLNPIAAA